MKIQEVSRPPATARPASQSAAASKSKASVKPWLCGPAIGGAGELFLSGLVRRKLTIANNLSLVQRLSAAGQAFVDWPEAEKQQSERAASVAADCPDDHFDLTVVATPHESRSLSEKGDYPEEWGTYLGTGGYC